jgi:glutaminase
MKREIEQEMSYLQLTAKDRLHEWVQQIKEFSSEGKTADYIPALKDMDSSQLGICLIGADGTVIQSGDYESVFTLQSISKVISFIAA